MPPETIRPEVEPLRKSKVARLVLAFAWAVSLTVPLVMLAASHHVEIQAGTVVPPVAATGNWAMTHILVESCPCSYTIATHLLQRGVSKDAGEQIWVAESGWKQKWVEDLAKAGFNVRRMTPSEILARANVNGGPWLIIHDPDGQRRYAGGYLDGRPGSPGVEQPPQDVQILARLQTSDVVQPFRALGCGMGESILQPLGVQCDSTLKDRK